MKKLFLAMVVALMSIATTFAQTSLVATLSHGEDITMYYGPYALRDAHNAAVSGDVISLSGGAFQAVEITKAITLRGTGIDDPNPTYIINPFRIDIPESDTGRLSMEGVRCTGNIRLGPTLTNAYFLKSLFDSFGRFTSNEKIKNAVFANCKITNGFTLGGTSTAQFINCYVRDPKTSDSSSMLFYNCSIMGHAEWLSRSQFINCFIYHNWNTTYYLDSTNYANYCVGTMWETNQNIFKNLVGGTYISLSNEEYNALFESGDKSNKLTDEAKTKYLGTDGTEVGMYGGVMPYDSTPSYPQITQMNVANKTTADGKLSVEIEVSATE